MNIVALQMLMGDKAKYLGIILGLTFASFLITQQAAIFLGLMTRTFGFITDTRQADIWVMDPKVQFVDDIKRLQDTALYRVRGIEGVAWAVPLYKGLLNARLDDGTISREDGIIQQVNLIGLDDATLMGGPPKMLKGKLEDLRRAESIIVDDVGANGKLAKPAKHPGGKPIPLDVGDTLELNDRRAVVVGICSVSRTFQSNPVVYTTYSRATNFAPRERKLLSFVMVGAKPGVDHKELSRRIEERSGLLALTSRQFAETTYQYFMKYTGIPINFGISVALGFLVGTAIAGQTFYNFTLDNLRHFGALKAMGASNWRLLRMILLQALVVGILGYGIGTGLASVFALVAGNSELAFFLPWQLLLITGLAITIICVLAACLSALKVMRLEPAIVFKG